MFGEFMHDFRADLDFYRKIEVGKNAMENSVDALITIDFGDVDVIFKIPGERAEPVMQEVEDFIAVVDNMFRKDDAECEYVFQIQWISCCTTIEFSPDAPWIFKSSLQRMCEGLGFQYYAKRLFDALEE